MSRIEELEQRISELLAADAGADAVFCQIKDLVKEYVKTLNRAIEIRKDNLAYVIVAVKYFLGILESLNENLTIAAQCIYRAMEIEKACRRRKNETQGEESEEPVSAVGYPLCGSAAD